MKVKLVPSEGGINGPHLLLKTEDDNYLAHIYIDADDEQEAISIIEKMVEEYNDTQGW